MDRVGSTTCNSLVPRHSIVGYVFNSLMHVRGGEGKLNNLQNSELQPNLIGWLSSSDIHVPLLPCKCGPL